MKIIVMAQASSAHEYCRSDGNVNMRDFIDLPGVLGLVNLEKVIAAQSDVYLVAVAPDRRKRAILYPPV